MMGFIGSKCNRLLYNVNYTELLLLCYYSMQLRTGLGGWLLDWRSHSIQGIADDRDQSYGWRSHRSSCRQHYSPW